MNSLANKLTMLKISQAIKMAQDGNVNEIFNSLSPQERERIKNYVQNVNPEQLNNIAGKIREIASNFSGEQIDDVQAMLNNMNPALAQKLEEVLK